MGMKKGLPAGSTESIGAEVMQMVAEQGYDATVNDLQANAPEMDVQPHVVPTAFTRENVGPSLAEVMQQQGLSDGDSPFVSDEGVYEYNSTAPIIETDVAYSKSTDMAKRQVAETGALLNNPVVRQHADPMYKEQLKSIAEKAKHVRTEDVAVIVADKKIHISAEVRDVPNRFQSGKEREHSLDLLTAVLGSKVKTIEVIKWAQHGGPVFKQKPLLWLSQQLSYEAQRMDVLQTITFDDVSKNQPGDDVGPDALTKLFSKDTTDRLMMIAAINKVNIVYVFRYLVDKICKDRNVQVHPETVRSKYDEVEAEAS